MTRDMNPVLLSLNCGSPDDTWLRNMARGVISVQIPPIQHVILQGSAEADRVYAAWARLKQKRGLPWGGGMQRVWKAEL